MKLLWQQISSSEITTIYCNSKFDGIVFDEEHGNFGCEKLFTLIQLTNANNKKSFVRFSELDKSKIRKALDAGVSGLIFSTVNNLKYSEEILNWCLYPPRGNRGQGLVAENNWGDKPELLQKRNPILIAQIESKKGISLLPKIQKTFDYFMLGPYDLTADLGCVAEWDHPSYLRSIQDFCNYIPEHKRAVHLVSNIEKEIPKFSNYGLVALGMDTTILKTNINNLIK